VATMGRNDDPATKLERLSSNMTGSALFSNTSICESSRVIDIASHPRLAALRICDLMALIDAVILHDRIYYLPATLAGPLDGLTLRDQLIEDGIIFQLPNRQVQNFPYEAFLASLSTIPDQPTPMPGGLNPNRDAPPIPFDRLAPLFVEALSVENQGDYPPFPSYMGVRSGSFDRAIDTVIAGFLYASSGTYEQSLNTVRAMYYVFASEYFGLPYLPSIGTQLVTERFPNYFKPAVRDTLYQKLASALDASLEVVAQGFNSSPIFIPPFSAIALQRAATREDIVSEIFSLRQEYRGFRESMLELEHEWVSAKSIHDRLRIVRRVEKLGQEAARPFDQIGQMDLQPALRYIPDAVEIISNPTSPAEWAKTLLGLPVDALANWYVRRPVAKLTRAGRYVGKLAQYDSLIEKHFGGRTAAWVLKIQAKGMVFPGDFSTAYR
jgi:hypothetical protein